MCVNVVCVVFMVWSIPCRFPRRARCFYSIPPTHARATHPLAPTHSGWITGHSYMAYGPLLCGCTVVMMGGIPTYPDGGRCWRMVERYKVGMVGLAGDVAKCR